MGIKKYRKKLKSKEKQKTKISIRLNTVIEIPFPLQIDLIACIRSDHRASVSLLGQECTNPGRHFAMGNKSCATAKVQYVDCEYGSSSRHDSSA